MWNLLFDAAVAVGGYLFADSVVEGTTGKHIHEHLFTWWCELRDFVSQWLNKNQNLKIKRVALIVLDCFDDFAVRTKQMADRVTLGVAGIDKNEEVYEICSQEASVSEVLQMFPEFKDTAVLVNEITN